MRVVGQQTWPPGRPCNGLPRLPDDQWRYLHCSGPYRVIFISAKRCVVACNEVFVCGIVGLGFALGLTALSPEKLAEVEAEAAKASTASMDGMATVVSGRAPVCNPSTRGILADDPGGLMRNTALLSIFAAGLGVSGTAHAGLDIEDLGSVESVTLSSATAVTLYTTPAGYVRPCVQVTIGEEVYIFGLSLNHGIYVGERLVAELGLEPEEQKDRHFETISTVEIDTMSIRE